MRRAHELGHLTALKLGQRCFLQHRRRTTTVAVAQTGVDDRDQQERPSDSELTELGQRATYTAARIPPCRAGVCHRGPAPARMCRSDPATLRPCPAEMPSLQLDSPVVVRAVVAEPVWGANVGGTATKRRSEARRLSGPRTTKAPREQGFRKCAEEDSNLHGAIAPQGPQPCASTNPATGA